MGQEKREGTNDKASTKKGDKRKPVLLVHGIQSDGAWQEEIEPVLRRFFRPVPVKYGHFRKAGPLLVMAEPIILLIAATLALYSIYVGGMIGMAMAGIAMVVAAFAFTTLGLSFRRAAALKTYYKLAGDALLARPHVIAHSFGTYLTGRLLLEVPAAAAHRVVLVGCVLPTTFDWRGLVSAGKVRAIRNDFSRKDRVVWFAGIAGRIRKELGSAGRDGFKTTEAHALDSPDKICAQCEAGRGALHNVNCSDLEHSGALVTRLHAAKYWLPYLWGLDTGEYNTLVDMCEEYESCLTDEGYAGLEALEEQARTRVWRWTGGTPLWEHFKNALKRQHNGDNPPDAVVAKVLQRFCVSIVHARRDNFTTDTAKRLHPHTSVAAALRVALGR